MEPAISHALIQMLATHGYPIHKIQVHWARWIVQSDSDNRGLVTRPTMATIHCHYTGLHLSPTMARTATALANTWAQATYEVRVPTMEWHYETPVEAILCQIGGVPHGES